MGESAISVVGTRDTARQQMPPSLRDEVRLVGELLGQVIAEQAGEPLLADVELLRRTVIRARTDGDLRGGDVTASEALVSSWSLDRAEQVARAFTCYFHLVNLAEERFRARALREPAWADLAFGALDTLVATAWRDSRLYATRHGDAVGRELAQRRRAEGRGTDDDPLDPRLDQLKDILR